MSGTVFCEPGCPLRPTILAVAAFVALPIGSPLWSQQPATENMSPATLRAEGLRALQEGSTKLAVHFADALVRQNPDDAGAMLRAGDIYLRTGKVEQAVRQFDRFLEVHPERMPGLWQRGIALYFAGDHERGARQFEEHRKVNPNDVENAAWHFLCVAKSDSFDKAREMVLPAPGDPRIPMKEVLTMLSNGDTDTVRQRMQQLPAGSSQRAEAEFYGYFYLGLYADAEGNKSEARELLARSAKDAPHHYMGDVARVYAKFLQQ